MKRLTIVLIAATAAALALTIRLAILAGSDEIAAVSAQSGTYTLRSVGEYGGIYDCDLKPLVNRSERYEAVVIPNDISAIRLQPFVSDLDRYYRGMETGAPFLCGVDSAALEFEDAVVFRSAVRTDSGQPAAHIIGYTSDGVGVCGLEKAYDELLRGSRTENSAVIYTDAVGTALNGLEKQVEYAGEQNAGVVTTLDMDIQEICENAADELGLRKGAIVVMDIKTSELKAVVSRPDYDPTNVAAYVDDPDSPLINRAFSAYSVGSIFKLVTASAALEQGISPEFSYTCEGSIDVCGQNFNCHKWGGHGEIDMRTAMAKSCNTYFIALSEYLDKEKYIQTASDLGFGGETVLCDGMVSAAGNLQTVEDISVPAERANMSFGQGKLTATPLQICAMTAAIANNGVLNEVTLIKGTRDADGTVEYSPVAPGKRVLSYETVKKLKNFMYYTVREDNSQSRPSTVSAAGKTSTAQTGTFDENGSEILNCWFTGYFPFSSPQYAVTIISEGGVSGNVTCGPIFARIADEVSELP